MSKDIPVGRVEELDNQVLRLFLRKNQLRWKDLFTILAGIVASQADGVLEFTGKYLPNLRPITFQELESIKADIGRHE